MTTEERVRELWSMRDQDTHLRVHVRIEIRYWVRRLRFDRRFGHPAGAGALMQRG